MVMDCEVNSFIILEMSGIIPLVCVNAYSLCFGRETHSLLFLPLDLKKVYKTARDSYGMGIMIPFGNVGRLEINYCFSQKRFSFLFCAM